MAEERPQIEYQASFLLDVLKRYDHYVATTNFKIGLLMSFLGAIILGLTIRLLLLESAQESIGCLRFATISAILATIGSSLCAGVNLLRAVFPNTLNENGSGSLIFFGSVVSENRDSDEYYRKVQSTDSESLLRDLATQTYNMAKILNEKFRVLKMAVNIMIFATIPFLALSLILLIIEG